MADTGVSAGDFTQIYTDFKRTVQYQAVTKTTDGMGNETDSFATATNTDLIFFLEENRYLFDKAGLIEVGDAYVLAPTSFGIKRYDRITVDSKVYYIQNVIRRHVMGTAMVDYGVLFLVG